jgi:lipopolysaccharide/colanic/teichoic acid biosynthesis glycosyltransferase
MKRILDLVLIVLGAPLWIPLFLVVLIVVGLAFGRPVFFKQERSGRNGVPFKILKFRTMKDLCDENGNLLPDEDRLTATGKLLRSLSLDEIPELWNVVCGSMSLVGPRPLPTIYLPRYSSKQRRRLDCPPGITGWAQVNGRNLLDWEERFEHDVWYVDNRSILLDIKILWMTLLTVPRREGISSEDAATMTEFMGTASRDQVCPTDPGTPCSPDPSHKNGS